MPIRTAIWKVATPPEPLAEASLPNERVLEEMIVAAPRLLSEEWMLIGRQEETGLGGRVDLLAVAPDGAVVLIELKRDRTPREVVAQALDYASWASGLDADDVAAIYRRFAPDRSLADDFRGRFGQELDEDALNQSHQIVVVAATLDDSTERIIAYLTERGIAINALLFQVFAYGVEQLISRHGRTRPYTSPRAAPYPSCRARVCSPELGSTPTPVARRPRRSRTSVRKVACYRATVLPAFLYRW
jgi:Endonuclease NucS